MSGPLLSIEGLTIPLPEGADRPNAIEEVSFEIGRGEIVCIVGESGSGKSMSASAVMGLLPEGLTPSAGRVVFGGRELLDLPAAERRRLRGGKAAMIFQEPMTALNPVMTVGDQIAEALIAHGMRDRAAIRRRVIELLTRVDLPDPEKIVKSHPFRLSGGQRQRVMIAIALANEPELLIADEPTTALDVTTQAQILELIREIQARTGMGVMFITHDFGVMAEIAHRVVVMCAGRVVEQGTAEEVLNRPRHPYTIKLIGAVPRLEAAAPPIPVDAPVVLDVAGLEKVYRGERSLFSRRSGREVHAADNVALTLRRGEVLGIVGESGSGKSTVGRCLVRLIEPDGGRVMLDGTDLMAQGARGLKEARGRMQVVFQDPFASLNPRRKVGDIICEAPLAHGRPAAEVRRRMFELLRLVGLPEAAADRWPHEFSGGQRQRIGIARALALDPKVLIADEAVSALDVSVQAQVLALLDDLRTRLDLAILFITHDLRVAARICHRVAVMRRGRIVEEGPTARVFETPSHDYTRALLAAIPGRHWTAPAAPATGDIAGAALAQGG
ncbi:ABC transporter ATP-binding protein [Tistrella mobilis]|uniref:ABC transporter ATP-binding protein n=1 Tax=Tistrella mobilis TaxID=171437 RepID=UPI003557DBA5